ncbi:MAG: c-type cytochrome [Dechloromonas sp.]|jgi:cytochrome c|nr:c-type cytochrome [Dechloromonas sp.]
MLQKALVPLVLAAACVAIPAQASEAIVKKARCVSCHAVDKKMVGPAFKDVAAKYKGDSGAPAKLAEKVRAGGTGVWGQIPMTPNGPDKISDADLAEAIKWILSLQ